MATDANDDLNRVKNVMAETFHADMSKVDETTPPSLVPGWDSVSVTVLVLALEEAFAVELPVDKIFAVKTVGDLVGYVFPHGVRG